MSNKLCMYLSIILLTLFSCKKEVVKPEFSLDQLSQISDEKYDIYSLVINEVYANSQKLIISQVSKSKQYIDLFYDNIYYKDLVGDYEQFDTSLVAIHLELNDSTVNFGEQFQSDTKDIIIVSSAEIDFYFDNVDIDDSWERFNSDFENSSGLIRFSRIAFNDIKTQAIFEISQSCGGLCGQGSIIFLEKVNNNWVLKGIIPTWVA